MIYTSFSDLLVNHKVIPPPLSGYTDYPFRCILAQFQPGLVCTEMVNARAVVEENHKTMDMIRKEPGNHFKGVQLVGNNPDEMESAAVFLEKKGFDFIDINMGCTVRKVVQKDQGVALMKDESLAESIVEKISSSVQIPVTVKMRSGFSNADKNAVSLSKRLERAGASMITVHGRSGRMKFGNCVDYEIIKKVVDSVDIPVIANGGVHALNCSKILKITGAAAVMPGRSIIGNPWVIDHIQQKVMQKTFHQPDLEEKKHIILRHLTLQCDFYGEHIGIRRFRTILPKYFRYCINLIELKEIVTTMNTFNDAQDLIEHIICVDDRCFFQ